MHKEKQAVTKEQSEKMERVPMEAAADPDVVTVAIRVSLSELSKCNGDPDSERAYLAVCVYDAVCDLERTLEGHGVKKEHPRWVPANISTDPC